MGTDVYLVWKDQTEEEKKKQITGWSIEAGNRGYLRASIGMIRENQVLRLLFPEPFWKGGELEYDFVENIPMLPKLLRSYLKGGDIDDSGRSEPQRQIGDKLRNMFLSMGAEIKTAKIGDDFMQTWAKSVLQFFELGVEVQTKGLKPKVYISW